MRNKVKNLFLAQNMHYSDFDGCQMGLHAKPSPGEDVDKVFLKKPWRFATNLPEVLPEFNLLCPGESPDHQHRQCKPSPHCPKLPAAPSSGPA